MCMHMRMAAKADGQHAGANKQRHRQQELDIHPSRGGNASTGEGAEDVKPGHQRRGKR